MIPIPMVFAAVLQAVAPPPFDSIGARQIFDLVSRIAGEDRGRLWGRSLDGPVLLVDPATRRVFANRAGAAARWTSSGNVFAGTLPDGLASANTAVTLDGERWTMVMWPLPADAASRRQLLAHELWHRIQDSLGLPVRDPQNPQVDDELGRVLLRLESRALGRAIAGKGIDQAAALVTALSFREERHSRYPGSDSTEALGERHEGLAEYTGVRMAGGSIADQRRIAVKALTDLESREHLTRSFAYATGPAYGLLLDEVRPGWRLELGRGLGPAQLARRAIGVTLFDARRLAIEEGRLGGPMIRAEEAGHAEQRVSRRRGLIDRFVTGRLLVLPLASSSITFDPNQVEGLDSLGTHYCRMELSGEWGVLDAVGGGRIGAGFREAFVPVQPGFTAEQRAGPGWTLELHAGWRIAADSVAGRWRVERVGKQVP